jgi:hypothetical protein
MLYTGIAVSSATGVLEHLCIDVAIRKLAIIFDNNNRGLPLILRATKNLIVEREKKAVK